MFYFPIRAGWPLLNNPGIKLLVTSNWCHKQKAVWLNQVQAVENMSVFFFFNMRVSSQNS